MKKEPIKLEDVSDLMKKNPDDLSKTEKKLLKKYNIEQEDKKYKENEISFGLRSKILLLVLTLLLAAIIANSVIAISKQTESLEQQLIENAKNTTISLQNAIKSNITSNMDLFSAFIGNKYNSYTNEGQFRKFYQKKDLNGKVFELVQNQRIFKDLVYVIVLGRNNILWSDVHTKKDLQSRKMIIGLPMADLYSIYKYKKQPGVKSYFDAYKDLKYKEPLPIVQPFESSFYNTEQKKITGWNAKAAKQLGSEENILDVSNILTLKSKNVQISDAIGEIHIGISKTRVENKIMDTSFGLSLAAVIAFILSAFVSIIAAMYLARPIVDMTGGMQKVAQGDFSAAIQLKSKDEIGRLSSVFNRMVKGLSILVSPEVAKVVLNTEDLYNSSEQREVSVLFSDIRGFTTISESLTPREVVKMLNDYLELMTQIIVKYQGVVDKFVGDEIFSVFGAPFDHPNHPLAAIAVGVEMGKVLAAHNKERTELGKLPINIGIGINTGPVIAGAMGSKNRVDYTSIGDAVNLGARLEGTNKVYKTLIIISEFTYAIVKDWVISRELDSIKVKGKNEPVVIYEVLEMSEEGRALADELIVKGKSTV